MAAIYDSHMWYLAISGEDIATYALSTLAYNTYATIDSDKFCCVPWLRKIQQCVAHSGSFHNDELSD